MDYVPVLQSGWHTVSELDPPSGQLGGALAEIDARFEPPTIAQARDHLAKSLASLEGHASKASWSVRAVEPGEQLAREGSYRGAARVVRSDPGRVTICSRARLAISLHRRWGLGLGALGLFYLSILLSAIAASFVPFVVGLALMAALTWGLDHPFALVLVFEQDRIRVRRPAVPWRELVLSDASLGWSASAIISGEHRSLLCGWSGPVAHPLGWVSRREDESRLLLELHRAYRDLVHAARAAGSDATGA